MLDQLARRVTFAADSGEPISVLLARLSRAEQDLIVQLPTERQRRHSALARFAGKSAALHALEPPSRGCTVEILKGPNGEPLASVDGDGGRLSVSLTHSGRMAAAFAWTNRPGSSYCAGIDLERIRPTEVASGPYAFSSRERKLIADAPSTLPWSGLAAWASKEAAWKALRPESPAPPICGRGSRCQPCSARART